MSFIPNEKVEEALDIYEETEDINNWKIKKINFNDQLINSFYLDKKEINNRELYMFHFEYKYHLIFKKFKKNRKLEMLSIHKEFDTFEELCEELEILFKKRIGYISKIDFEYTPKESFFILLKTKKEI